MRNTAATAYIAVPTGVTVCSGHVRRNQRSRCRNPPGHLCRTIGHVPGISGHVGPEYSLLHSLSEDIIDSEDLDHDIKFFLWGDKEIESLVDLYFPINTSYGSGVKEMLLEGYNVTELGLPNCIPPRLRNYFQAIVDYEY